MPYTLVKALVWMLLALALGITIGWLLRSVLVRRQFARARGHRAPVDGEGDDSRDEVDVAELERLRGRVANLETVATERDRLAAELESLRPPPSRDQSAVDPDRAGDVSERGSPNGSVPSRPDLDAAAAALGGPIELDDLTVIEGLGPSIEELCHGIGIRTWYDLSTTEVSLLRTMLTDAGPRFKTHDPSTWPHQAELLAHGRWDEFREVADGVRDSVGS